MDCRSRSGKSPPFSLLSRWTGGARESQGRVLPEVGMGLVGRDVGFRSPSCSRLAPGAGLMV